MPNNPNFQFTPTDGFLNTVSFPTSPADETAARTQFMTMFNQIRDFMNGNLVPVTTANITFYVNTATGNDSNDGLTSGTAFKTIQKAIDVLPQIINHTVTINTTAGTYNETVTISGFSGKGTINLYGDTIVSTNYSVNNIVVSRCGISVVVRGFNATTTSTIGFNGHTSTSIQFDYCNCTAASAQNGFQGSVTVLTVSNSIASNRNVAIAANKATIYSDNNTGTGNTVGLSAGTVSTIGKNGTQPGGTTAQTNDTSSVIR